MPHVILEYTSNIDREIDTESILGRLFELLVSITGVAIDNCKGRVIERGKYRVGTGGEPKAFVHCCIRVLAGRSKELKGELGKAALTILKEYFLLTASALDLQITVEIQDIAWDAYFKEPAGTLGTSDE